MSIQTLTYESATPSTMRQVCDLRRDEDTVLNVLLEFAPNAEHNKTPATGYRELTERLIRRGWSQARVISTIRRLKTERRLFVSSKRKSVSLLPFERPKGRRGRCTYCGRVSKNLTKDHVIPRSKGGSNDTDNIVLACANCNEVKADRTPVQWCRSILEFRRKQNRTASLNDQIQLLCLAILDRLMAAKGGDA